MLFLVFGSSAAGKTLALGALRGRVDSLAIHDLDEIGVPSGADRRWRRAIADCSGHKPAPIHAPKCAGV
jgi:hypothetical protein